MEPILLQVLTADEHGPITLQRRLDKEEISLSQPHQRQFYIVYTPVNAKLGTTTWDELYRDLDKLKEEHEDWRIKRAEMDQLIEQLKARQKQLDDELKAKTDALREANKQLDPARFDDAVRTAVAAKTKALNDAHQLVAEENARLRTESGNLRSSNKKIKDANDRLHNQLKDLRKDK
jgi:chromosome segregation ATPase